MNKKNYVSNLLDTDKSISSIDVYKSGGNLMMFDRNGQFDLHAAKNWIAIWVQNFGIMVVFLPEE